MMFCEHLDKFFPYTQVEIVRFPDGSIKNPNNFKEFPVIKGSVVSLPDTIAINVWVNF